MTVYQVRVGDVDARPTAVIRELLPPQQVDDWVVQALRRVAAELVRQRIDPIGPPFARYTPVRDRIEVEADYVVSEPVEDEGAVVASGLPGGPVVIASTFEDPTQLEDAYRALASWLSVHGFRQVGPYRETYRAGAGSDRGPVDVILPYGW